MTITSNGRNIIIARSSATQEGNKMKSNYTMPDDYLMIVRQMVMDNIDENIISDWIVLQLNKGAITSRMYELGISTMADMKNTMATYR